MKGSLAAMPVNLSHFFHHITNPFTPRAADVSASVSRSPLPLPPSPPSPFPRCGRLGPLPSRRTERLSSRLIALGILYCSTRARSRGGEYTRETASPHEKATGDCSEALQNSISDCIGEFDASTSITCQIILMTLFITKKSAQHLARTENNGRHCLSFEGIPRRTT